MWLLSRQLHQLKSWSVAVELQNLRWFRRIFVQKVIMCSMQYNAVHHCIFPLSWKVDGKVTVLRFFFWAVYTAICFLVLFSCRSVTYRGNPAMTGYSGLEPFYRDHLLHPALQEDLFVPHSVGVQNVVFHVLLIFLGQLNKNVAWMPFTLYFILHFRTESLC